jgi:NAD(P)-dependent dehydrogenase (short-subunit alcohol dehydrogenase family)
MEQDAGQPAQAQSGHAHTNRYDLSRRVAVITGGAGGVGQGVTPAFLRAGATVVAAERAGSRGGFDQLKAQLGPLGDRLAFSAVDVLDEASVEAMVAEVLARHGQLDILVNLVGGFAAGQPITQLDLSTWQRMQDLNLHTAFLVSKHAARPMIQQRWGRILNISSRGARSGRKHAAAYAVAKAGIITLTEAQAEELRDDHITVNCILPSIIDTPANRASMPGASFDRWPRAEEVARVLLFLASDDAWLINGAAIPVYGLA